MAHSLLGDRLPRPSINARRLPRPLSRSLATPASASKIDRNASEIQGSPDNVYGPHFGARYVSPDGKRLLANVTETKSRKTTSRSKQATEKLDIEYPLRHEWGA